MTMTIGEAKKVLEDWNNATAEERAVAISIAYTCMDCLEKLGAIIEDGVEIREGR